MRVGTVKIAKIADVLSKQGFFVVSQRLFLRCLYRIPYVRMSIERYLFRSDLEKRFIAIYKLNYWGNIESASGGGSTSKVTANLREKLPYLLRDYEITSICDAPCGDFLWMKSVISEVDVRYKGVDIVPALISRLSVYTTKNISFEKGDIRTFNFDGYDLVLVRDCLFHFSYTDINAFLENLSKYDYKYLLTTSYQKDLSFENRDIETGDFRKIDLLSAPFNFDVSHRASIEDWAKPESERFLYLWDKKQVPTRLTS
jgi:hypothetical protein